MNFRFEKSLAADLNFKSLKQRIEQRLATVAVMGLGYVGLPLAEGLRRHHSELPRPGEAFYSAIVDKDVSLSSTRAAEMTKLLENIHRAVNIGLVNEMKVIADRMDLDVLEIIDAAATKPFGFVRYLPGPGLGGHCIPIDPFYLTWKARLTVAQYR